MGFVPYKKAKAMSFLLLNRRAIRKLFYFHIDKKVKDIILKPKPTELSNKSFSCRDRIYSCPKI